MYCGLSRIPLIYLNVCEYLTLNLIEVSIIFCFVLAKINVKNTEGVIQKDAQSRETDNISYTRHMTRLNKPATKKARHYTQAGTHNVNKTCSLLQTTGSKDEQNIVCMWKS